MANDEHVALLKQGVAGKRQEADITATPAWMLDGRPLVAARGTAHIA